MKFKVLSMLSLIMIAGFFWGATNDTVISTNRIQTRERERTRLEEQIRLKLKEKVSEEESQKICDRLFNQIGKESREEKEYENTLRFMKTYMERNRNFNPEDLYEVGEFYQKNKDNVEGTLRQKRNTLMQMVENRIRNRNSTEVVQTKEREQNMNKYQNRVQNRNLSQNQENAEMMRQKSAKGRR